MTVTIPTLETERLLLRANQAADLPAFEAMWQNPDFYRFLGGQPLPRPEVWTKMLRSLGMWHLMGYGYWGVEEKSSGQFIGGVGFAEWQRDITPSLAGFPEAGWVLAPHAHGRGYGTEAMRALMAWGDAHLPERRTVCLIDHTNAPSLRLAAKLGYQEFARSLYHEALVVLLERHSA